MSKYKNQDVYLAFCQQFRNAELAEALNVELVRVKHVNRASTLFREIAGRPQGSGAWFSWASTEPLEVSWLREMADGETPAWVFALADVPIIGLPVERIHLEESARCVLFLREGTEAPLSNPRIVKLETENLSLLDGLFDHPDIPMHQRNVYRSAYEVIISAEDTPDFTGAVYGLMQDGQLVAAIQLSITNYASLGFSQNAIINPFTRPDRRGNGFGSELMKYVLGLFPGEMVQYEYDGENESAQRLAEACGFQPLVNIDMYRVEL